MLFLGLSDGARIADFRRANRDLNNEQIWQTHELPEARAKGLLEKLAAHAAQLASEGATLSEPKFRTVVLLDDFTASGTSYYRTDAEGRPAGKIAGFHRAVVDPEATLSQIVDDRIDVIVLLYMATEAAKSYLQGHLDALGRESAVTYHVEAVQEFSDDIRFREGGSSPINGLIDRYYDHSGSTNTSKKVEPATQNTDMPPAGSPSCSTTTPRTTRSPCSGRMTTRISSACSLGCSGTRRPDETPRNPFRLRRSESIDSEATFLSLFEPGILDILPVEAWKESVQVIRSAAGGGKTSLMRLFVPGALQTLHTMHTHRTDEQLGELFQKLKELGAIDEGGPKLLGVSLLCGRGYSRLEDLPLDDGRKSRLFFGLLNARIVLAVLHNLAAFKKLDFPEGLAQVQVQAPAAAFAVPSLDLPCDGLRLFEWARDLEHKVCSSLDSFGPLRVDSLPGHDSLPVPGPHPGRHASGRWQAVRRPGPADDGRHPTTHVRPAGTID